MWILWKNPPAWKNWEEVVAWMGKPYFCNAYVLKALTFHLHLLGALHFRHNFSHHHDIMTLIMIMIMIMQ